jgi:quercetin dioxygenase-like cupin family protein
MTEPSHFFIPNLLDLITEIQPDSILSRTIFSNQKLKVILFDFAEGQELSEHTATKPALLHFLEGDARLTVGEKEYLARPGTWVQMEPNLTHSVYAQTQVLMLLILIEN